MELFKTMNFSKIGSKTILKPKYAIREQDFK